MHFAYLNKREKEKETLKRLLERGFEIEVFGEDEDWLEYNGPDSDSDSSA